MVLLVEFPFEFLVDPFVLFVAHPVGGGVEEKEGEAEGGLAPPERLEERSKHNYYMI